MRADIALLKGACDLHIHSGPSMFERLMDDTEVAQEAERVGMKAIVLKDHHVGTFHRAYFASKEVSQTKVFGGLVLNYSVGGLNPFAVDVAIKSGARIIWMPTIDSENHRRHYGELGQYGQMKQLVKKLVCYRGITGISIYAENDRLDPHIKDILNLIADSDVILATGHLSIPETKELIIEAKKVGVEKIIVTHVDFEVVNMRDEDQRELANAGAYMEYAFSSISPAWHSTTIEDVVQRIKAIGPNHCILSSDLGQIHNPPPTEGLRIFYRLLLEKGLKESEIRTMSQTNPSRLLGLS